MLNPVLAGFWLPLRTSVSALWLAFSVSAAFAILAFFVGAVNRFGAFVGALVCLSLCVGIGAPGLAALVAVFFLAWLSTKIGYQEKTRLGTAEKTSGRNGLQIVANLGVAAACAILFAATRKPFLLLAIAASMSEAAADTVSSEIGQLSRERTRLITNWSEVVAGTDGGVTIVGTLAGLVAAAVVSAVCGLSGMISWRSVAIPMVAAFCGVIADSVLGASLERRKLLNNDMVNFLGTLIAALIAVAI